MFIRMVWGKLRPGSWEEYERHYHERLAGASGDIKGLKERQLLRGTEDPDEGISVSIWETLDDPAGYETGEFRQNVAQGNGAPVPGRILGQALRNQFHRQLNPWACTLANDGKLQPGHLAGLPFCAGDSASERVQGWCQSRASQPLISAKAGMQESLLRLACLHR